MLDEKILREVIKQAKFLNSNTLRKTTIAAKEKNIRSKLILYRTGLLLKKSSIMRRQKLLNCRLLI